jgi:hypothetical protein
MSRELLQRSLEAIASLRKQVDVANCEPTEALSIEKEIEAELAKPESSGMTVLDTQDDDDLRFVQRVLESDAPAADRQAARDMVFGIRTRVRGRIAAGEKVNG